MGIVNERNTETRDMTVLDGRCALLSRFNEVERIANTRVVLEGFLIYIVLSGKVSVIVENVEYVLREGDIFSCMPRNVLERPKVSNDIDVRILYLSSDFAEDVAEKVHVEWTFGMMTRRHEIVHAEKEDMARIVRYFDLVRDKIDTPDTDYKIQSIEMLFGSLLYDMFDIRCKGGGRTPQMQQYSAAENLLQRFVKLLNASGHKIRSVNEYATRLCVSSKYFSSVCKQLTGKPASDLINDDIIRSAQLMLTDNSKSLKQIADELNFKNQSHFGTFFRRHVGVSPQQYRDSYRSKKRMQQ